MTSTITPNLYSVRATDPGFTALFDSPIDTSADDWGLLAYLVREDQFIGVVGARKWEKVDSIITRVIEPALGRTPVSGWYIDGPDTQLLNGSYPELLLDSARREFKSELAELDARDWNPQWVEVRFIHAGRRIDKLSMRVNQP